MENSRGLDESRFCHFCMHYVWDEACEVYNCKYPSLGTKFQCPADVLTKKITTERDKLKSALEELLNLVYDLPKEILLADMDMRMRVLSAVRNAQEARGQYQDQDWSAVFAAAGTKGEPNGLRNPELPDQEGV